MAINFWVFDFFPCQQICYNVGMYNCFSSTWSTLMPILGQAVISLSVTGKNSHFSFPPAPNLT